MIALWIEQVDGSWFAVAHHGDRLVATAIGADRDRASQSARASLPRAVRHHVEEQGSEYARAVVRLLARLEAGTEGAPAFELCPDCVGEPLASVAQIASAIPRGFVATYGGIASAAGTDARVVGRIMATNPLYPIIPCHRVVGADLSLVGYTGSQGAAALRAKLERLRAERGGHAGAREVRTPLASVTLEVHPVEAVIARAARDGIDDGGQLTFW